MIIFLARQLIREKQLELMAEFKKACSHKCTKWPTAYQEKTKLELKKALMYSSNQHENIQKKQYEIYECPKKNKHLI